MIAFISRKKTNYVGLFVEQINLPFDNIFAFAKTREIETLKLVDRVLKRTRVLKLVRGSDFLIEPRINLILSDCSFLPMMWATHPRTCAQCVIAVSPPVPMTTKISLSRFNRRSSNSDMAGISCFNAVCAVISTNIRWSCLWCRHVLSYTDPAVRSILFWTVYSTEKMLLTPSSLWHQSQHITRTHHDHGQKCSRNLTSIDNEKHT